MATVTQPRPAVKARRKVERFITLDYAPTFGNPGLVTITMNGVETAYQLDLLPNNCTPDAYRVTKLADGESYDVCLDGEYGPSCGCLGFTHHRHCKHIDGLRALRDHNKL
jgi:hypothetical protein